MQHNSTTPEIGKRIEYVRETRDYAVYVTVEDHPEQLLGYVATYGAAEKVANDFAFDWYNDRETPEAAAALLMEDLPLLPEEAAILEYIDAHAPTLTAFHALPASTQDRLLSIFEGILAFSEPERSYQIGYMEGVLEGMAAARRMAA